MRPAQAAGAVSFSAEGENVSVRGVEAKNGYLIAEADVAEGCTLAAKLGEEELQTLGLGEGRYAVSLPRYMTEAFSVTFSAESGEEEEDPAGGCGAAAAGGYGAAGSIGIAAVAAASFAVLKRRKRI